MKAPTFQNLLRNLPSNKIYDRIKNSVESQQQSPGSKGHTLGRCPSQNGMFPLEQVYESETHHHYPRCESYDKVHEVQ